MYRPVLNVVYRLCIQNRQVNVTSDSFCLESITAALCIGNTQLLAYYKFLYFLLSVVRTSCYEVDLAFVSIASMIPILFACVRIACIFCMSISIGQLMSKYILTIINVTHSTLISTATVSSSDIWFISIASISLFFIIAALLLPAPDVNTEYARGIPMNLLPML